MNSYQLLIMIRRAFEIASGTERSNRVISELKKINEPILFIDKSGLTINPIVGKLYKGDNNETHPYN
jgi:hypothetical protein